MYGTLDRAKTFSSCLRAFLSKQIRIVRFLSLFLGIYVIMLCNISVLLLTAFSGVRHGPVHPVRRLPHRLGGRNSAVPVQSECRSDGSFYPCINQPKHGLYALHTESSSASCSSAKAGGGFQIRPINQSKPSTCESKPAAFSIMVPFAAKTAAGLSALAAVFLVCMDVPVSFKAWRPACLIAVRPCSRICRSQFLWTEAGQRESTDRASRGKRSRLSTV